MINSYVNITTDCDEVLVLTNHKWFRKFLQDPIVMQYIGDTNPTLFEEIFSVHPNNSSIISIKETFNIFNRQNYDLLSVLNEDVNDIPAEIKNIFLDVYFNDSKFYDDLPPSNYLKSLHTVSNMYPNFINEINVITHCGTNLDFPCNLSKKRWLSKHFKGLNSKIKTYFHFLEMSESKGHYIANNIPNYTSFVDDSLKNIIDVAENTISSNKEILIPLYGYNSLFLDKAAIERDRNLSICYFNNLN